MSAVPDLYRATFLSPYLLSKGRKHIKSKSLRLGDLLLSVVEFGAPAYIQPTESMEFSVIDLVTRQKAWFETPPGSSPEQIGAMIEGHFDATAYRVDSRIWVVQC